jgi:hypothetical protein
MPSLEESDHASVDRPRHRLGHNGIARSPKLRSIALMKWQVTALDDEQERKSRLLLLDETSGLRCQGGQPAGAGRPRPTLALPSLICRSADRAVAAVTPPL